MKKIKPLEVVTILETFLSWNKKYGRWREFKNYIKIYVLWKISSIKKTNGNVCVCKKSRFQKKEQITLVWKPQAVQTMKILKLVIKKSRTMWSKNLILLVAVYCRLCWLLKGHSYKCTTVSDYSNAANSAQNPHNLLGHSNLHSLIYSLGYWQSNNPDSPLLKIWPKLIQFSTPDTISSWPIF